MNALFPPRPRTRFARPLSRSDWAIHFPTQTPVGWFYARSLHSIRTIGSEYLSHSTVVLACTASGSRYALGPYNTVVTSAREARDRLHDSLKFLPFLAVDPVRGENDISVGQDS